MKYSEPWCMATALPTVPHRDPIEACRLMLKSFPEAPCIPRLSMSARMYMDGMPCLVINTKDKSLTFDISRHGEIERFYEKYWSQDIEYFAMSPQYAAGLYTMIDMLRNSAPESLKLVHTQMPGVVTWGLSLKNHESDIPAWYNETMRDIIVKTLTMKAKWQEKKIRESIPGVETMITLGEPSLGAVSSPFGSITEEDIIRSIDEIFENIQGIGCVHCCSNMDWPLLMKTKTKVINFDAYRFSEKIALYPQEIERFLANDGMLAWGIVPVSQDALASEDRSSLFDKLEGSMDLLVNQGLDRELILKRSFIMPACVTSTLSIDLTERAFHLTKNISDDMRRKHAGAEIL